MNIKKLQFTNKDKYSFVSAMIIGLGTHMFMLTNKLLTHDSMFTFYDSRISVIELGRFLQSPFSGISSYFDLQWVNGLLSIFYAAIIVVFLVSIFEIKKTKNICLMSLLFMTFPALTSTFSFMHLADGYILALLVIVISIYLLEKGSNVIGCALLLTVSLAVYQTYISFAMLLCLLLLIKKLSSNISEEQAKKTIMRYLLYGVIGIAAYFVLMKLSLVVSGEVLKSYQGVDTIGSISLSDLPRNIIRAYWHIIKYIFIYNYSNPNLFTFVSYLFLFGISIVFQCIKIKENRISKINLFLCVLFIILVPIATNIFSIVAVESEVHTLMTYQYVLLLIYGVSLLEEVKDSAVINKMRLILMCSVIVLGYNYFIIDNIAYNSMHEKYEKSYSITSMIANRIQLLEDYSTEMEICFVGELDHNPLITYNIADKTLYPMTGVMRSNILISPFHIQQFINHYVGLNYPIVDEKIREEITAWDDVTRMPIWPSYDSVKIIDEYVVVKLSDF